MQPKEQNSVIRVESRVQVWQLILILTVTELSTRETIKPWLCLRKIDKKLPEKKKTH